MIDIEECWSEKAFTYVDNNTGEQMHFATDRLRQWAHDNFWPIVLTPVNSIIAEDYCQHRGIEKHRLERLTLDDLNDPILYAEFGTGDKATHLCVDGHHRFVFAAMLGIPAIKGRIITREHWEKFLISGVPDIPHDFILNGYSGIN